MVSFLVSCRYAQPAIAAGLDAICPCGSFSVPFSPLTEVSLFTISVPDQVTEVSTEGEVSTQVENVSYDTNDVVHEISSSIETVTITEPEVGLSLIASIGESNILSNRSGALDIARGSTNTAEVHEIEVDKDENATKGKVSTEEYKYDLEKILDEQETHDLYCPNCKSCITRRVILKNRKGYGGQPKRQHADESLDQESPEVFRCLSCFTFFIPTGILKLASMHYCVFIL